MNRRDFTKTIYGMTALASVQRLSPQNASSLPFKLSVMATTLGAGLKPDVLVNEIADVGYQGIEMLWADKQWSNDEIREFNQVKRMRGILCDCVVDRPGPGGAGIVGAADPRAGEEFPKKVAELLALAKSLEAASIIIRPGARILNFSRETQHDTCIDNLKRAGEMGAKENILMLLENGDREEQPNAYLTSVAEGIEIVRRVGSPNVKMLYDFYHEQIEEGGLIKKLDKNNIDLIGTVHVADNPGRHDPGTGEINYPNIVKKLVEVRFSGWMAMEYRPLGDPVTSLREAREMVLKAAKS